MRPVLFHLGSGDRRRPAGLTGADHRLVNVDCRPRPNVHAVGDVSQIGWLVARFGRPAGIAAEDVLEHLPRERARAALLDWIAHLRPGGTLHIRLPDLWVLAAGLVDGGITFKEFERRVYGQQDYPENTHRCGFTRQGLMDVLTQAGLSVTRSWTRNHNACVWAMK